MNIRGEVTFTEVFLQSVMLNVKTSLVYSVVRFCQNELANLPISAAYISECLDIDEKLVTSILTAGGVGMPLDPPGGDA